MAIAEAISINSLNTLKAVAQAMENNQLPRISQQALMTIGTMEGESFKKALVAIANNNDPQDQNKNYIYGLTSLLTPPILDGLASLGFKDIPPSTLITLGRECAQEFRGKLSKALQGDKECVTWIASTLRGKIDAMPGPATGNQPPTKPNAPQRVAAVSPQGPKPNRHEAAAPQRPPLRAPSDSQPYPDSSTTQRDPEERQYLSVHLYGKAYALCFQASEKNGEHSINLDAAQMVEGQRKVNWANAIHFRFTERELISMYACMIGFKNEVKFSAHGPANDKTFNLKRQDKGFYASCSAKDEGSRGVPFDTDEGVRILALIVRQLLRNHPEHSPESLDRMVRSVMTPPRLQAAA